MVLLSRRIWINNQIHYMEAANTKCIATLLDKEVSGENRGIYVQKTWIIGYQ